jgi:putative ABC transport system permease protein
MKEESRAVWIWPWLEGLAQDLRMEVRQLGNARGFTLTAVAILALGIGLNAAVFTVLNGVALRPFPLPHPEQLTYVMEQHGDGCCSPPSWLDQRDIREQQRTFQSLAAYSYDNNFLVTTQNQTRHFAGGYVTANYFETLGVRPVAGRVFTTAEAQRGRDHVVLLREDFWRSEFGNKADNNFSILGTTMLVNGVKCDVVGILPAWFGFPSEDAVIWTPLVPTTVQATQRGWHGFPMVGRIKPGISMRAAKTDLNVIMSQLSHHYSEDRDRVGAIFPLQTWGMEDIRSRLLVLQFAALGIFLMTCANVSSLLLARYSARRREYALRAALGASRLRQSRQHLTEALLLALLGCTAGIAIAWTGVKLLLRLYQDRLPRISGISVDWHLVLLWRASRWPGPWCLVLPRLFTRMRRNWNDLYARTAAPAPGDRACAYDAS